MSWTTARDFLLGLFQSEAQSIAGCVRFLVSWIMLLVLPSLDLTPKDERLDIQCHPKTNDEVTPECLSKYSAETKSFITPYFLVWMTASLLFVFWSTIIFHSAKDVQKIKRMTSSREKEHLCREFWKKFFLHVCCETVLIAVSLVLLCYTQKMYLTESTYYCPLRDGVTCSIVYQWEKENPIFVIIGGMVLLLVLCMWTICDAICNEEEFIKDLVNSTTGNEEGKERLEINVQPLK